MAESKTKKKLSTGDVKAKIAEQSRKNRTNGGEDVVIEINRTIKGRITEDFGQLKKDHVQNFSPFAFKLYDENGVIEKIN